MHPSAIELDLSRYAVPRPADSVAKKEFLTAGTASEFEAQRAKEFSSITHEYGMLDEEELKEVERSFQRVHLAEISAEIISHLRSLTSVSAGQIYEAAQRAFTDKPTTSGKQMLANIKNLDLIG